MASVAAAIFVIAFMAAGTTQINPDVIGFTVVGTLFLALSGGALMVYGFSIAQRADRLENAPQFAGSLHTRGETAWDAARRTLDDYIDRNLTRGTMIFYLSVAVMIVGFVVVLASILSPRGDSQSRIAATSAGVITQFIGATFLFVYQSTVTQSLVYARMLERVTSVGVALAILADLADDHVDLMNTTKADLARLVVGGSTATIRTAENISAADADVRTPRESGTDSRGSNDSRLAGS